MTERTRLWPAVLGTWTLAAVVLCLSKATMIARLRFHDPDDAMRLLEVRDWLGGQSWWDVDQHRLGGGTFHMHWSRLVDLPLAGTITVLRPLVGAVVAERIALVAVPLLTLLLVMALVAAVTRRVAGDECARTAILIVPITAPLVAQLQPMRIDHHGWQVACALAAVAALLGTPDRLRGTAAGLALACLVTVSFEGLPFAVALVGVAAVAWAIDPARRAWLLALATSFTGSAVLLHLATRGPAFFSPACDAVAPGWLAMLAAATVALAGVTAIPSATHGSRHMRLALLALAALAPAAVALLLVPDCLSGPFGRLDPLTRTIWFDNVSEGLPIWRQRPLVALMTFGLPLVGLLGTLKAWRTSEGERRLHWLMLLALLLVATALAATVLRAGGTANALAIPGAATLVTALLHRARLVARTVPRVVAIAGALVVAAPGLAAAGVVAPLSPATGTPPSRPPCTDGDAVSALAALPASRLFAPLDLGPEILVRTQHQAVASGYHRNVGVMHQVVAAFTGRPEQARAAVTASGVGYVVACPGLGEGQVYIAAAPNGFLARLERGERFAWLDPVPLRGSPVLAWRLVNPPAPPARPLPGTLSAR